MPSHIVDVSARSRVLREQPLLSHAWVMTPPEALAYLRRPRSVLRTIGVRLPAECAVETVLRNHDWLTGHSDGLGDSDDVVVYARGDGDGQRFYRVMLYGGKAARRVPDRPLLHDPTEEERPTGHVTDRVRGRVDAIRRSMTAAPIHTDVHTWLAPLTVDAPVTKSNAEAHRVLATLVDAVRQVLPTNPAYEPVVTELSAALQRQFNPGYSSVYRAYRAPDATFPQAFTGLLYAKAVRVLATSGFQRDQQVEEVARILDDPAPALRVLTEAARAQDPDFFVHATVEATMRRRDDGRLDRRLVEAEDQFASFDPDRGARRSRLAAPSRRLELLGPEHRDEWWFLPALVAYAINVWPLRGDQTPQ
ncbi:hypothetical protein [Micromonospora robiginosa]|uniref:Uncharacterized protein n=1 Tax=Micromonospora robiginosa TaxID=2749844 RepID=A0A7L6B3M7_9ACTN|nr:hypothetical protein [Micromonospora ferruginea]QLQ36474.1 hypothetical protein H1D33_24735 [Micromonospora ferruginea]